MIFENSSRVLWHPEILKPKYVCSQGALKISVQFQRKYSYMSKNQMPMEYFLQNNPTKKPYQQYFKEMWLKGLQQ